MEQKKDFVTITCYNQTKTVERKAAVEFFTGCMFGSEGSEQSRYVSILSQLHEGETIISDERGWKYERKNDKRSAWKINNP